MSSQSLPNFSVHTTPLSDLAKSGRRNHNTTMRRTGRKTFKTDGRGCEAIWPESLEAVLLQGIEQYRPDPSRTGRTTTLQRHPKRNLKISQYILRKTGVERSAKQVGSRIQQLRSTCTDPYLVRLLNFKDHCDVDSEREAPASPPRLPLKPSRAASRAKVETSSTALSSPPVNHAAVTYSYSPMPTTLVTRAVSLEVFVVDGDWSHRARSAPHMFLDLEEPGYSTVDPVIDLGFTTSRSHLSLCPSVTVKSLGLVPQALYRTRFTVFCDNMAVDSHYLDTRTDYECLLTTQLSPDQWCDVVQDSHNHDYTIVQNISPIDSPASPEIEITYALHLNLQEICSSPLSTSSVSSYGSSPTHTVYHEAWPHVVSPVEGAYDYSTVISPVSEPYSSSTLVPSYPLPMPHNVNATESYSGDCWSIPADNSLQLHLQYPAPHPFSL